MVYVLATAIFFALMWPVKLGATYLVATFGWWIAIPGCFAIWLFAREAERRRWL